MKRKAIIILLLSIFSAFFTIAVRAERRSSRIESNQRGTSSVSALPRLVSSSVVNFFATQQEETDLVLAGCVFLLLGLLSQKRARQTVGHSKPSFLISPVRASQSATRVGL